MSEKDRFIDLLSPHSRINPAEEIEQEEIEEGGEEDIFELEELEDPDDDEEDDMSAECEDEGIYCSAADKNQQYGFGASSHQLTNDELGLPPFDSNVLNNQRIVNQYVQVEFEVKDEFKPAFKTILSIMKMFKDEFVTYDRKVLIINGLVKNINLQSKKINWYGWRKTLTEHFMTVDYYTRESLKKILDLSLDDLKTSNVPLHSIETKTIPISYFERERLNREFLDCFQEDEGKDYRDIDIPSWKELSGGTYTNSLKVVNIRKDPAQADGNERVYCKVQFNVNHPIKPLYKKVGQFIGTFGPYTSAEGNSLITDVKASFMIEDGNLDEQVDLIICGDDDSFTDKIYIYGFEYVEDKLKIFRKELKELPEEIILPLQDINRICNFDMTIMLKPELFESGDLLNRYLAFKKQKQYVSTRTVLTEIVNLLEHEASVTKNYIEREMGTSLNGYMYADKSDMDEFADTLPPHLKKLVKEAYKNIFSVDQPEEVLGLHGDLHEMLGFITDIEKLQFHFSPKPFKTDDPNEPEIMEKVNIEINMSIVGTSAEDMHQHLKNIEGKTAKVGFVAKYINN